MTSYRRRVYPNTAKTSISFLPPRVETGLARLSPGSIATCSQKSNAPDSALKTTARLCARSKGADGAGALISKRLTDDVGAAVRMTSQIHVGIAISRKPRGAWLERQLAASPVAGVGDVHQVR